MATTNSTVTPCINDYRFEFPNRCIEIRAGILAAKALLAVEQDTVDESDELTAAASFLHRYAAELVDLSSDIELAFINLTKATRSEVQVAQSEGSAVDPESAAENGASRGSKEEDPGLLHSYVQELHAMLEGAEGLARKETNWVDVEKDPLVRLITMASTKFECDLMPMIGQ